MRRLFIATLLAAGLAASAAAPALAAGTVILANGGHYFTAYGPSSAWRYDWGEGYCGKIAGWCSPGHFQWTTITKAYPATVKASWTNPSPVSYFTRVSAFVPRKDATATIDYAIAFDHISGTLATVAQSIYYDQWVPLTSNASLSYVTRVDLGNATWYGSASDKVAFDEIKIEN